MKWFTKSKVGNTGDPGVLYAGKVAKGVGPLGFVVKKYDDENMTVALKVRFRGQLYWIWWRLPWS
jgi:hypothetical protein